MRLNGRPTKRAAFSLIEMVISLVVLILCSQLLLATVKVLTQSTRLTKAEQQVINWHISTIELTRFMADKQFVSLKRVGYEQRLVFASSGSDMRYTFTKHKKELVVSSANNGYMPLMDGVARLKMTHQEPFVIFEVTFTDGGVYQYECFLAAEEKDA